MSTDVSVKKTEPRTVAFISIKGPYDRIAETFGTLFGWVVQKGYTPAGPPMGIYFNSPEMVPADELLWELQCPLSADVSPIEPDASGCGVKRVEEAEVASVMHKGSYEEMGRVYGELFAWITQNGYDVAGPSEEVYFKDPAETPPEELLTEVRFPVKRK